MQNIVESSSLDSVSEYAMDQQSKFNMESYNENRSSNNKDVKKRALPKSSL
jgi:hypothetical protein